MPQFIKDDIHLHFTDEGQGEPVVLIHGFPLSSEMWVPQRAVLTPRYRVISVDLRGFGRSDPPTGTTTVDSYADDVAAIIDALGFGQATIAGFSMGGYVTMALLRRHPNSIKAVALVDTKMTPDTDAGKQGRNDMITKAQNDGASAVADAMLPKMLTDATRRDNPELAQRVRDLMAAAPVEGIVGALEALRDRPDSTETLRNASIPALIIVGADDALTTPADAQAMQATLASAELVRVPNAAHLTPLEQPAAVNDALVAFMDRVSGNG